MYKPAGYDSDSASDYDGFYFNDMPRDRRKSAFVHPHMSLHDAACSGDLVCIKEEIYKLNFDVNKILMDNTSLLLMACSEAHFHVVKFLVVERKADVNMQVDSYTPLMALLDSKKPNDEVKEIAIFLLKHGAIINVSDMYGVTPFMRACKNGYMDLVRLMLKEVSKDSRDNEGSSAIFYAIESNQPDILKLLIEAGFDTEQPNRKGYTAIQVAKCHGFYDLLEILPKAVEKYFVPCEYLSYSTLRNVIPQIFLKTNSPDYFPEIVSILYSMKMEGYVDRFAKAFTSLQEFLTMTDERLRYEVGFEFPIHRVKIMRGLLNFHLNNWSVNSIECVNEQSNENFYHILLITANQLQQFIFVQSALRFICQNVERNILGDISKDELETYRFFIKDYRASLRELLSTVKYLSSFSPPKNPLYIDYNEYLAERKRRKVKKIIRYTSFLLGISIFVCYKFRQLL